MTQPAWSMFTLARAARIAGLLAFCAAALLVATRAAAQETPEPTGAATEVPTAAPGETVIRLDIDAPEEPIAVGDIIQATVLVDNVEHLAGFDFTITYDAEKLQLLEAETEGTPVPTVDPALGVAPPSVDIDQMGAFLESSPRGGSLFCHVPSAGEGLVVANCFTTGPPVCLGGAEGATGSGVLAVIPFESRGGGATGLEITSSTLVLDDLEDPCPADGSPVAIPHTRGAAAPFELAPKDDSSATMIIIIIVIVAVVVAVVGVGGYFGYQRYRSGQPGE